MKTILALILALTTLTSFANQLQGKVIKVTDGDTVNVLTSDNETHRIRLSGIDAPEKKQAFGSKSKQVLADLIDGKTVNVEYNKLDRYQRVVGKITFNGQDVNLRQIKLGLAWHYKKYEKEQDVEDRSIYANAEYLAQRDKIGLWYDANPIAPWDFRKQKREQPIN
jgi:endonuclease YncB( thermonuclease family)